MWLGNGTVCAGSWFFQILCTTACFVQAGAVASWKTLKLPELYKLKLSICTILQKIIIFAIFYKNLLSKVIKIY